MDEGVEVLDGEEQVKACKKVVELNLRISQWLSYDTYDGRADIKSFASIISFKIIWNLPLVQRWKGFNPCFLKRSKHIFSFAIYYRFLNIFPMNIGVSIKS